MWEPEGVQDAENRRVGVIGTGAAPAGTTAADERRAAVVGRGVAPEALPAPDALELPETLRYRLKNRILGPPLASERQSTERLGKPTALAVLSSDVISSSAYATEQMLIPLVKAVGVAAFSLVVPVSIGVIVVLLFVTLSYLEVVKVYTKAGGAYVVSRENFGLTVAQIAAVSLLIDYTLTVAVSVAAGVAALTSLLPALTGATTYIAIALVLLIALGNLRGIREAGRAFALPTYFFVANMAIMIAVGAVRALTGSLHPETIHKAHAVTAGAPGQGLLFGAGLFVMLRAFSSGGSALTGTEAISNGVSVFRRPEARNARITMIVMAAILGSLVLGISSLAALIHPVPFESGTPTVLSEIAKAVYGNGALGRALYVLLQIGTMLILTLAANTSFTGFPFLASFAAEDSYLPRQLTRRGHRLVFSSGIIVLTVVSVALLAITRARVDSLIPLYAIGVFTGFTMAGLGMAKYHLTHREPQWRRRLAINGTAAILSFVVLVVIAVTTFADSGAWTVVILLPLGVVILIRLHRQYATEDAELEVGAAQACEAPVLRRHAVIVLVDRLDLATARAIQYARTLAPDQLRAVHFAVDPHVAAEVESDWRRLGLTRLPLDVIECPDRRLGRAALELAAEVGGGRRHRAHPAPAAPGLQRRLGPAAARPDGRRHRGDRVPAPPRERHHRPLPVGPQGPAGAAAGDTDLRPAGAHAVSAAELGPQAVGTTAISDAQWRTRVRVAGRVKSVRVPTRTATAILECTLADRSGAILLVFQGRRSIPGIRQGARLVAEGMVGAWDKRLAILNPDYELIAGPDPEEARLPT